MTTDSIHWKKTLIQSPVSNDQVIRRAIRGNRIRYELLSAIGTGLLIASALVVGFFYILDRIQS